MTLQDYLKKQIQTHKDASQSLLQGGVNPEWLRGYVAALADIEGHIAEWERIFKEEQGNQHQ